MAGGLALVLVLLGVGAFTLERSRLQAEEQQRLAEVEALVDRGARSASVSGDPARLEQAVVETQFSPSQPQLNQQLLAGFASSWTGERNRAVSLFDPAGRVTANLYPTGPPSVRDLGEAWQAALAGRPAVSPVFVFDGVPMRATVAPVGGTDPWAVLVTVNPDQRGQTRAGGISAFGGQRGGVTDVDATGTALASWDPSLVGKQILDPAELAGSSPQATRTWTVGDGNDQTTYVSERQATTGYTTLFGQRSADLYADLRSQQQRRDVTLAAVLAACLVGLAGFGLYLQRGLVRQRERTKALLAGTDDLVLVVTRNDPQTTSPRGRPGYGGSAAEPTRRGDSDARLRYVGDASVDLLGRDPGELVGTPLVDLAHPTDVARLRALLLEPSGTVLGVRLRTRPATAPPDDELDAASGDAASGDAGSRDAASRDDADGENYRWFDVECTDLVDVPAIAGVLVTCHEIGDRKALEDRLTHQAQHDPLTGLANRAAIGAALDSTVVDATATSTSVAVLFVDLDQFKPINDTYGHDTGDVVLRVASRRINGAVRSADVVGRLGGDEFVAILPGADETVAAGVAERVVAAMREPIAMAGRQLRVSASVGVAVADLGGHTTGGLARHPAYLLRAADDAMYRAKASGGGQWALAELNSPPGVGATGATEAVGASSLSSTMVVPAAATEPESSQPEPSQPEPSQPLLSQSVATAPTTAASHSPGGQPRDWPPPERLEAEADRRRRSSPRWWLRSFAVVVLAAIALGAVFAVAVGLEQAAERRAEQHRVSEVLATTYATASSATSPQALREGVSVVPWVLDGSASNEAALRGIAAQTGGPTIAALFAPDGRLIEAYPPAAAAALSVDPGSAQFQTALGGAVGNAPMTFIDGAYRLSYLVPAQRDGTTVAVLVLAIDTANLIGQRSLEAAASTTLGGSGLSLADVNGRVIVSWDRDLIGQRLVDPAVLRAIPDGRGVEIDDSDPDMLSAAARVDALRDGGYFVRQIPTSDVFAGLRPDHVARDIMLFSVIAVTVALIMLVTIWRDRALRRDEERRSALLHNAHDIVAVLSRDSKVTFVSSAIVRLLGYSSTFWQGASLSSGVHPDDAPGLREQFKRALGPDGPPQRPTIRSWFSRAANRPAPPAAAATLAHDVRIRGADGAYRWFDIRIRDLVNDRDIRGILLTSHEIGDRKRLQDQLARQARYDALTGLANRAELTRWLDAADDLARSRPPGDDRPANSPQFSVLFIDLDHFKSVNDTFGHRTGDAVLQIVADRLSGLCRDSDGMFRLGGDEFVMVLDGADETAAHAAAQRVLAALHEPLEVNGQLIAVGATVGIALSGRDLHGPKVLQDADRAMYRGKLAGRGIVGA